MELQCIGSSNGAPESRRTWQCEAVTEWLLQESLTQRWLGPGIDLGGEKLLLVAWELMVPSWEINDAAMRWNEPSIDFLAIDRSGRLVAIELKIEVPGRKPAWAVLCQVTHRAVCVARTVTPELLERAHDACVRGEHGRTGASSGEAVSISHRFSKMFGTQLHEPQSLCPVRRVAAATAFGPSYAAIRRRFEKTSIASVLGDLAAEYPTSGGQAAKEFRRLGEVLPISASELETPVETLLVETSPPSTSPNALRN